MKYLILFLCIPLMFSCVQGPDGTGAAGTDHKDATHFQTTEEFIVPVRDGYVTQVSIGGEVVAEAVSPMTILLPKSSFTKSASGPQLSYVPMEEYPNDIVLENRFKLYQVVCFEDSKVGDYDYNDLVIHVLYKVVGNKFGFAVQPIALGSTKSIKLGCVVYKGNTFLYKGLITPEGKDCRQQYFESQDGFINTVGTKVNQKNGGWHSYLGSTIRNWKLDKIADAGAMRVEWYIEVDNGVELYALSTDYLNKSFDKNGMPYGLVITGTGSSYIDKGDVCGHDWFNYPQEAKSIEQVYPEIWQWLTSDQTYNFPDIYSGKDIPATAYPASDLGLFSATDVDVTLAKYCQN